ncbi:MAG: hypothetical protein IPI80_12150 [Burkholderiales bacterium]|nr:hypothetical protein [Burkholderiales bacterium]
MLPRFEDARDAALQADLHLPTQNETPLWCTGAVELAAKPDRAGAQLVALRGKHV